MCLLVVWVFSVVIRVFPWLHGFSCGSTKISSGTGIAFFLLFYAWYAIAFPAVYTPTALHVVVCVCNNCLQCMYAV